MAGQINYGINFNINNSQLKQLKTELQQLKSMTTVELSMIQPKANLDDLEAQLQDIHKYAGQVEKAFTKAFNVNLGTLNLKTLNKELEKLKLDKIGQSFAGAGSVGTQAFMKMSSAISSTNLQLKQSSKFLDDMATTMANTAKWGVASSILNNMSSSIQKAWSFTKELDKSLTDIRIVTGKSADEMERFARVANNAAQKLGKSTKDFTDASLIYYQQGLGDVESQQRAEITLKTANVTGQNTADVSEQLTAVWNGYKVASEEAEMYVDKLAAVAADTAADLEELSTGMSKVASAASIMGVDIDQLSATLATVISVTRQAPESVGTAFKTIYARMGDIQAGIDTETSLDAYTQDMLDIGGINVLNANNELRDMGEVIEEVGQKWSSMTREQQVALSQVMAGTRQYNNLLALFDNWNMYTKALETSESSLGELNRQQDIYMQSTEAHLEQLATAWERVFDSMADTDSINGIIDVLTGLTNGIANFTEALGGGGKALLAFGTLATKAFNKQLATGINNMIKNSQVDKNNIAKIDGEIAALTKEIEIEKESTGGKVYSGIDVKIKQLEELKKHISSFDVAKIEEIRQKINQLGEATGDANVFKQKTSELTGFMANMMGDKKDEKGKIIQKGMSKRTINEFVKTGGQIEDGKSADLITGTMEANRDAFAPLEKASEKVQKAMKNSAATYIKHVDEMIDAINDFQEEHANLIPEGAQAKLKAELEELINIIPRTNDKDGNQILDEKALKATPGLLEEITGAAEGVRKEIANASAEVKDYYDTYDKIKQEGGAKNIQDRKNKSQKDFEEEFKNDEKTGIWDETHLQEVTESMIGLATGMSSVASAWMTISNLGNIISDENLSTGEKFLQIIMALGTAVPMMASGIKDTIKGVATLTTTLGGQIVAQKIKNAEEAKGAALTSFEIAQIGLKTLGTKLLTLETYKQIAAQMLANWYYLAAAAAIGAVVGIIYLAVKAYNADAEAAKKAAETAKELADAHNEAKEELENLKSSFDAYDEAKKKLEDCTEGTKEWKEALKEVNATAVELINNLGDLSAEDIRELYSRDENGMINIDQDKMDELMAKAESKVTATQYAAAAGQADATHAQLKSDAKDIGREIAKSWNADLDHSGNEMFSDFYRDVLMNNLDKFENPMALNEFEKQLNSLGIMTWQLSHNELKELQDELSKMASTSAAAEEKLKLIAELTVQDIVGEDADAAASKVTAEKLQKEQDELNEKYLDKMTGGGINKVSGADNDIYEEILGKLQEAGYDYDKQKDNAVRGSDSNRSFAFLNEEGEEVIMSAEKIAQIIAASEATKNVEANQAETEATLNTLEENIGKELSDGIKQYMLDGNFESMSKEDFDKLQSNVNGNAFKYLLDNTGKSIWEGGDILDIFGKPDEMKKAMEDYQKALDTLTDGVAQEVVDVFDGLDQIDGMSVTAQKAILETLNTAFTYGGKEAMTNVANIYSKLGEENLDEFNTAISGISDWTNTDVADLQDRLKESGVATKFTTEELANYIEAMRASESATRSFTGTIEKWKELSKNAFGLERGDTIDEETYKLLSSEMQKFFTLMLDGTYKLTGSAIEYNEAIKEQRLSEFKDTKDSIQGQIAAYKQLQGYDFEKMSSSANYKGSDGKNYYNRSDVDKQIELLQTLGKVDSKQANSWINDLSDKNTTTKVLEEIAEKVKECKTEYDNLGTSITNLANEYLSVDIAMASSFNKLSDLKQALADGTVGIEAYTKASLDMLDAQREEDFEPEEIENYARYIRDIADESDEFADSLSDGSKKAAAASRDLAIQIMRMNDGVDALADGWKDWSDVLKKSSKESEEYYEALTATQEAMADLLDTNEAFISNDFIQSHMKEIGEAATGSAEAIDKLHAELAKDIVVQIAIGQGLDQAAQDKLVAQVELLQSQIPNLEVGASLDTSELESGYGSFLNTLGEIIDSCNMTADQANEFLCQIGDEADFETEPAEITQNVPVTVSETEVVSLYPLKTRTKSYQDGTESIKQTVEVPRITSSSNGKTPKIKNLTKKASGSANNYSSKNKGGGSPGKSSGGSKDPDKMDKVDKSPDRYHKVDTQLDKIGNQLDKIQSQEKKLIGAELIENINAQLGQLDNRLDQLREKVKIAQGEAGELRDSLANQGVKFNDDGTIANYMEIYNAKVKYVNDLIDKYNAMSAEEQEKYKETVEQAKEDLDKFTEDLDRYDELVSDFIPGLNNEIQDAIDEEIELNIKKFNLEFDVRLNMKDATKDWNEFKKRILDGIDEDDIYGNAKARATDDFSNMIGENGVQASTKQAQEVLAELKEMDATGWSDVYGDDRAKALEDLKTAYETINEDLMEIDQIQKDVYQAWLDTMDEINDKMADQVAMYEQVSNLIDHDMKVIQLIYGETDYEALGKYYDKQHQNNLGLLDFQRQNADFWEKEMNSIDKEKDPDAWKKARDNWISAVNDLNATVEASIENARDKMENTIDDIFQKFNNEITDGKGLDYLAQQWDLVNDNADDYLDTVNAAFGIRQLENKYQDAIDLTDNISAQRKLNDLMESELKALREKDKLTEYDIERANMKYEIALKQIALEEAQQTKTTMRLRRDSQGNYRYEYIADEDAIGKLQDELDVLENSLYNFDKERWIEMQNQVVDAVQERQDAIKEIMMDASLSEEERAERLAEINRLYNEKIQNITDQTVTAQNNLYQSGADELAKIWEAEGKDFQSLSNEEQRILTEEMLPQFETGVNDMITKFSGPGGFEDMTVGSMNNLKEATNQYNQELDEIEYNAGVSFDKVEEGIDKNIPKTQQLIEDNDTLNQEYQEQIDKIKELNLKLQEQADKYKKIAEEAKKATQEAYNYWMEQQRQAAGAAEQEKKNSDGVQNPNEGNKNDNNPTNGGNKNPTGKTTLSASDAIGVAAAISLADNYGGWGTGATRSKRLAEKFTNDNDVQDVINRNGGYKNLKGEYNAYKNKLGDYYYSKFDTGGYTGDWAGNYGKFAMLHSKELVLNAHDTDNMLNMMQIARDVIALAGPRVGALSAGKGAGAAAGQLEQNVHIEANFPNVESASEIEEALNNLVQLASQRATRNTRG